MEENMNVINEQGIIGTEEKMTESEIQAPIENGGSILPKIILGAAGIAGAGIALWKNREKIKEKRTERQIRKLEDKGFIVRRSAPMDDDVEFIVEDDNDEE